MTAKEPRANLIARDQTMSAAGGEYFPYSGQTFVRLALAILCTGLDFG